MGARTGGAGPVRARGAVACALVLVAAAVVGCGGDSGDGGAATPSAPRAGTTTTSASRAPEAAIATVGGAPVSARDYAARRRFEELQATVVATGAPALRDGAARPIDFDGPAAECAQRLRERSVATIAKAVAAQSEAQLRSYCRRTARRIDYQAVNGLLAGRVTEAEAQRLGIAVSASEVAQQEAALWQQLGGAGEPAAARGVDRGVLREKARITALERKLYRRIVATDGEVTDADRRAFYERNRSKFDRSERRDLLVVEAPSEAEAEAAKRELEAGAPFAEVAERRSRAGTVKRAGGRLEQVARRGLPAALGERAFAATRDVLVGPFEGSATTARGERSFYLVRVERVTPRGVPRLDRLTDVITQAIAPGKAERAVAQWQESTRDRWRPRIDCRPGYAVSELCGNDSK